jgi:hypothetical protein
MSILKERDILITNLSTFLKGSLFVVEQNSFEIGLLKFHFSKNRLIINGVFTYVNYKN